MRGERFDWKRLWLPVSDTTPAPSGTGLEELLGLRDDPFGPDPDSESGRIFASHAETLESMRDEPCLVLLGEAGVGKTTEVENEVERLREAGCAVRLYRLGEFDSGRSLREEVFGSRRFRELLQGGDPLHLFLDGLDEGPMDPTVTVGAIDRAFEDLNETSRQKIKQQLRLRLVCRTGAWQAYAELDFRLAKHWSRSSFQQLELAALSKKDVALTLEKRELPTDVFLQEIYDKQLGTFAARPLTLLLLLDEFDPNTRSLPRKLDDIYSNACLRLCEEESKIARQSSLSADQRLAIARRLAAVMIFSGRSSVLSQGEGAQESPHVSLRRLAGGEEPYGVNGHLTVDEPDLLEVVSHTNLFIGQRHRTWLHRNIAEFLAADYLRCHKTSVTNKLQLLAHPADPDGKVPPQLCGVASWMARQDPEIFANLAGRQPELLLGAEIGLEDDESRGALVDRLMDLFRRRELLPWERHIRGSFASLAHPGLANQLLPVIQDRTAGPVPRVAAIRIARDCRVQALVPDLVEIALNKEELDWEVRAEAAWLVAKRGSAQEHLALRPLALGHLGPDPDDRLKGAALDALWPEHIGSQELFANLTERRNRSYNGSYHVFVVSKVLPELEGDSLIHALDWVAKRAELKERDFALERLQKQILRLAWEKSEERSVRRSLARTLIALQTHYRQAIRKMAPAGWSNESDERRRLLVSEMVRQLAGLPHDSVKALHILMDFLSADLEECPWAVAQLERAANAAEAELWGQLVAWIFYPPDLIPASSINLVLEAMKRHPELKRALRAALEPVDLDSERADMMRQQSHWRKQPEPEAPAIAPEEIFGTGERGKELFAKAYNAMTRLDDRDGQALFELATQDQSRQLIEAAHSFIEEVDPGSQWLGTQHYPTQAIAGYWALALMARQDPDCLLAISSDAWARWLPALLAYPESTDQATEDRILRAGVVAVAADAQVDAARRIVIAGKLRFSDFLRRVLRHLRAPAVEEYLLDRAKKGLDPEITESVLRELWQRRPQRALEVARGLLVRRGEDSGRAIAAVTAMTHNAPDSWWAEIEPLLVEDPDFSSDLFLELAQRDCGGSGQTIAMLGDRSVAELFHWLLSRFPRHLDPRSTSRKRAVVSTLGSRWFIAQWRDELPTILKERGTQSAVDALQWLCEQLPEDSWLELTLRRAREVYCELNWAPLAPEEVIRVARDSRARVIRSDADLRRIVLEALALLQSELRGHETWAENLWDGVPKKRRPKAEAGVSRCLKRELERVLTDKLRLLVLREVEILPPEGAEKGQRADFVVAAQAHPSAGTSLDWRVVIELKLSCNSELKKAMKAQLTDRYLQGGKATHRDGVYLVCWFDFASWDEDDVSRLAAAKRNFPDADTARRVLEDQASRLSQETGARVYAFVLEAPLAPNMQA